MRADLAAGKVVVVTGFQGVDERRPHHDARPRRLRHLGRGGGGGAEGRRVPDLHRRRRRLHHRSAHRCRSAPARRPSASRRCSRWRASAPRCCRSARSSSPASTACRCACCRASRRRDIAIAEEAASGTLITFEEDGKMEQAVVSGIAFNRDEAKITLTGVPDKPGIAYQILGPVADANIDVDVIMQNVSHDGTTDFSFTVHRNDYQKALDCSTARSRTDVGASRSSATRRSARSRSSASACARTSASPARCSAR